MTQAEVIKQLIELGITMTPKTVQRYTTSGLAPKPSYTNKGRSGGNVADYNDDTPAEIYASYQLNHAKDIKVSFNAIPAIRELALRAKNTPIPHAPNIVLASQWLGYKEKALSGDNNGLWISMYEDDEGNDYISIDVKQKQVRGYRRFVTRPTKNKK